MGDSPGTVAPAAASVEAEDTLGARTAADLAGSRSSSGAPAVGAVLRSDYWATWARQVEAEFARSISALTTILPMYRQSPLPPARQRLPVLIR